MFCLFSMSILLRYAEIQHMFCQKYNIYLQIPDALTQPTPLIPGGDRSGAFCP